MMTMEHHDYEVAQLFSVFCYFTAYYRTFVFSCVKAHLVIFDYLKLLQGWFPPKRQPHTCATLKAMKAGIG